MTETSSVLGLAARFGLEARDLYPNAQHAMGLLKSGRTDEALRIFAVLVLAAPEETGFQLGLSEAALTSGRPEIALQAAAAAISLDPQNPVAFLASGLACLAMGEATLAQEDLADALRLAQASQSASADIKTVVATASRLLAGLSHE